MRLITNTTEFQIEQKTAVAIGKFDGIHVGHRKLLQEILEKKKQGLAACVFTFDPEPAVFFGVSDGRELSTREEKRAMFEQMGVDFLVEFPMNHTTAATDPVIFVEKILCKQMQMQFLAAGTDLSFGAKGAGNMALLDELKEKLGFETKTIDKVCMDGTEVSSTYVRAQVEAGNMEVVKKLLGSPYKVRGKVIHGNAIGRTIGFPTANIQLDSGKLLPPNGVYYSETFLRDRRIKSISNIGCKPTVTEEKTLFLETYLYDFSEEIYGEEIEVSLLAFRRPEQKFDSLEALRKQIEEDKMMGETY